MDWRSARIETSHAGLGHASKRVLSAFCILWLGAAAASVLAQDITPELSSARTEAARLADEYIDTFIRRQRLEAGNGLLEGRLARPDETARARTPGRILFEDLEHLDARTLETIARITSGNVEPLVDHVSEAATLLESEVERAEADWKVVRTSLNQRRFMLFEVKAGRRMAGQLASLLSVDKRWFWLFGVFALVTLVGVVFHDRRHEIRRLLNGGRARAMGLSKLLSAVLAVLVVLALVTFFMSNEIYESLLMVGSPETPGPLRTLETENAALAAEVALLEQRREAIVERYRKQTAILDQTIAQAFPARSGVPAEIMRYQTGTLAAAEAAAVLENLPAAMSADADAFVKLDGELRAQTEACAQYLRLRQWIRGGLGITLICLTVAGGVVHYRGVRQRRRATASTCPLCLTEGHLVLSSADGHHRNENVHVEIVRCKSIISDDPYEECAYAFMDAYRAMTKACFPTLGVPQAGKTHWLAMLYWELNRGNYPRSIQFEKIRSQSSEDFDVIVEEILRSRIGTAATQRDRIPHPLVFNFQDHDRWGRSEVLVNIFDYSGEVTADMGLDDHRRRRALEGDGFFFFLDPTYPSEPQAKALADFREDIRLVKGVGTGRQIRIPIAICVSKIDIIAGHSHTLPDGGDAIARYYDELSQIDPTGESMTLDVLEARSELTARLRDTIWPGWQIERQIDDLFGGRYLFFPLTPVGLDGRGEADLSLRTIAPFGLLEPLLWLLEMNGYPVLE